MSIKLRYLYRAWRYRLRVDPAELRFVARTLRTGQTAVDIGCHKGAYTYWMRRRVGPSGAVFAFEPQQSQQDYLRSVFSAMSYDNVALVPMAVSNRAGELPLHVPRGGGQSHAASLETSKATAAETQLVDVTTLDAFFADRSTQPDLLKIDVEGHELAVLEGAANLLSQVRPAILVECEARHRTDGDVRPVFELLHAHGYVGSFFQHRRRRPLSDFEPAVHQPPTNGDELPPGYVNNFAFVHPEKTYG